MTTDPTPAPVPPAPAEVLKVGWAAYYESDPWIVSEIEAAMNATYAAGVAAGRKQAAADIRDAPYPDPSPCLPAWHAGYTEATETAARIAEGTDRG